MLPPLPPSLDPEWLFDCLAFSDKGGKNRRSSMSTVHIKDPSTAYKDEAAVACFPCKTPKVGKGTYNGIFLTSNLLCARSRQSSAPASKPSRLQVFLPHTFSPWHMHHLPGLYSVLCLLLHVASIHTSDCWKAPVAFMWYSLSTWNDHDRCNRKGLKQKTTPHDASCYKWKRLDR